MIARLSTKKIVVASLISAVVIQVVLCLLGAVTLDVYSRNEMLYNKSTRMHKVSNVFADISQYRGSTIYNIDAIGPTNVKLVEYVPKPPSADTLVYIRSGLPFRSASVRIGWNKVIDSGFIVQIARKSIPIPMTVSFPPFAANVAVTCLLVYVCIWIIRWVIVLRIPNTACNTCGYDCDKLDRCPECGLSTDKCK